MTLHILKFLLLYVPCAAFITNNAEVNSQRHKFSANLAQIRGGGLTRRDFSLSPTVASLVAGSVAGAVGVGVAFPLDTLKTKSQVLGSQSDFDISASQTGASELTISGDDISNMNMWQLFGFIYRLEGITGFYGGVKGMMIGQAIIKSGAFCANASGLAFLSTHFSDLPSTICLLLAACWAGFVTSFLVTPIERVKVLMQASNTYKNEIDCLKSIIENDDMGVLGIFNRGLWPTLLREIPSYGIYFVIYGLLMQLPIATALGKAAPLFFGAFTGMASWIPVYPVDVVKTLVQNSDGSEDISALAVAKELFEERGIGGFFDGLTPKMLRAAVNHSVTFYVYDIVLKMLMTS